MDSLISDPSGGQSLADIESYLVSFNKEISEDDQNEGGQSDSTYMLSSGIDGPVTTNSPVYTNLDSSVYHVTPDMGSSEHIVDNDQVSDDRGVYNENDNTDVYNGAPAEDMLEQGETSHMMNSGNPVDESAAMPEFQTVTLVPSANSQGEVSYMLIVSQDNQVENHVTNGRSDMSVFDFKEEGGGSKRRGDEDADDLEPDQDNVEEDEESSAFKQKSVFGFGNDNTVSQPRNVGTSVNRSFQRASDQLMCNYCNYTSNKRFLLSRHMKAHSEERPHKCDICGRAFKTTVALNNHLNTHRGIKPNKCKECNAAFTTSGELIRHVRYIHTFEKPHKCNECDYASVELSKLKRHIRSHTGERPYQCPHCMYASPDTFKLKRHLRVHSGEKPYVCEICDMRFTQSNSRKSHMLIHSGEKPVFQCELCPTTCGRKTDLKNHVLKIHTSDRPLMCKKCGKSFPDRYTYRIHSRTHDGQKCFRCELCPYSAHLQRQLETHILTHTGEKPYKCHRCDMAFRQKQLLKRHINLYHNPTFNPPPQRSKSYACTECSKSFALRGNLLRHLAIHFPDNEEYQAALEGEMEGEEEGVEGEGYSMLELQDEREENNMYDEGQYIQFNSDTAQPITVKLIQSSSDTQAAEEQEDSQRVYLELNSLMLQQQQHQQPTDETAVDQHQQLSDHADANEAYNEAENEFSFVDEAEQEQEQSVKKKKIKESVKQSPARSRKNSKNSDEDYNPAQSTPRRRGRPPKSPRPADSPTTVKSGKGRKRKAAEMEESIDNDVEHEGDASLKNENDQVQTLIKQESDGPALKRSRTRVIKSPRLLDK